MCDYCSEHRRKKWFLDADNYHELMLKNKKRQSILQKLAGHGLEYDLRDGANASLFVDTPFLGPPFKKVIDRFTLPRHTGQVITLKDAIEIVNLAENHVLLPCACRKMVGDVTEMCCLNLGPMRDLTQLSLKKEGMEEISAEEAKVRLQEWHDAGLFSGVFYALFPFPIAICNCDAKYCNSVKHRFINGITSGLLKGHEFAIVDSTKCKCEEFKCMNKCQFGAMYVDHEGKKIVIDSLKCFGCGLCAETCPNKAITMRDRETVEITHGKW